MRQLSREEWTQRVKAHAELVAPMADAFLQRRTLGRKHPVHDFLFTYYTLSPAKLKQWIPSFEEALCLETEKDLSLFSSYWFEVKNRFVQLNPKRLQNHAIASGRFVEKISLAILERAPRFGCYGLHEWAMVYRLPSDSLRHIEYSLRLSPEELARFVESQNLCCTHYDAYRFFTPQAASLNSPEAYFDNRVQQEQGGCLHANMDLYKWATSLWPWIGSDFIAKAFFLAVGGERARYAR